MALLLLVSMWIWNALIQRSPVMPVAQQVIVFFQQHSVTGLFFSTFCAPPTPFRCLSRQLVVSRPTTVLCVTNCYAGCDCGNSDNPFPLSNCPLCLFSLPPPSQGIWRVSPPPHTYSLSSQQLVSTHLDKPDSLFSLLFFLQITGYMLLGFFFVGPFCGPLFLSLIRGGGVFLKAGYCKNSECVNPTTRETLYYPFQREG